MLKAPVILAAVFGPVGLAHAADLAPFDEIPVMSRKAERAAREPTPFCARCYVAGLQFKINALNTPEANAKGAALCLGQTGVAVHDLNQGDC
jgi:hypothetical protein